MSEDDTSREELSKVTEEVDADGDFSLYNLPKSESVGTTEERGVNLLEKSHTR